MNKNQNQHSNNKKQNRPIKFRGKCIKTGKWYYGHYYIEYPPINPIRLNDDPEEKNKEKHWIVFAGFADWNMPRMQQVEIDPETVGQYIGQNDLKNNELYDGDVCLYNGWKVLIKYNIRYAKYDLIFIDHKFYEKVNKNGPYKIPFNSAYNTIEPYNLNLEIINNIYDNPDLLKREDIND